MAGVKNCFPKCRDFNCTKRSLRFRGSEAWCEWTSEPCDLKGCTYAMCYKRQLLENGVCGMTVKRKTRDDRGPENFVDEEIRVRGKLMRKMGEKSIY